MINEIAKVFEKCGIEFEFIAPNEIVLTCPADTIPGDKDPYHRTMSEIISDPDTGGFNDEICIHIEEKGGCINWLVVDNWLREDEEEFE